MKWHRYAARVTAALALGAIAAMAAPVELKRLPEQIEVSIGGTQFTTYYFLRDVAKPYLMPLKSPAGVEVSRPFPIRNDISKADRKLPGFEPHQRPLYFGHGDINGVDFWTEAVFDAFYRRAVRPRNGEAAAPPVSRAYGRVKLVHVEEAQGGPEAGRIRARFTLEDANNRVLGEEIQAYTFRGDNRTRTVDCEYMVDAGTNPIVFGDTKEGTFAVRLNAELSTPHDHMLNSHGAVGEQAIWGKPADWVNYSGTVSGKPVGVVVFEHPSSFRHPTTWHARAYGLLAANPFAAREFTKNENADGSWTVPEGKSIVFRYRVMIYDGVLTADKLAEMYRLYAAGPSQ
ncbi:MAG TPA: PmoA family protein [Bryobacteraceae bacterium]|nr:PmoA family protein [Bryobacteraceae bacterium]